MINKDDQHGEDDQHCESPAADAAELRTAVIIVDHGSRKAASNEMLLQVVQNFRELGAYEIVEPAHMELAQPDIRAAFAACVQQGAERIIVFPYFLSPGRHWSEDIPQLTATAAADYPDIQWLVTAPFGLHSGMSSIILDRIQQCTSVAVGQRTSKSRDESSECDVCDSASACEFQKQLQSQG